MNDRTDDWVNDRIARVRHSREIPALRIRLAIDRVSPLPARVRRRCIGLEFAQGVAIVGVRSAQRPGCDVPASDANPSDQRAVRDD